MFMVNNFSQKAKDTWASGSSRLSSLLESRRSDNADQNGCKQDEWAVGSRYKALQPLTLLTDPWLQSPAVGTIRAKEDALLLDMWREGAHTYPATALGHDPPLFAYLASTRKPEWMAGWVELGGAQSSNSRPPKLGKRQQRGSWEVGGRYAVLGAPLLRAGKELDSQHIGEVNKDEEVLIVELALVMLQGEPRLRGLIRADSGQLGWLTVELPWGGPLLRPLNLYSEEALRSGGPVLRRLSSCNGRNSTRLTLQGTLENSSEAWAIGGKYRLLRKVTVYKESYVSDRSQKVGTLKKGALVSVLDKDAEKCRSIHLKVTNCTSSSARKGITGWIATTGQGGEALVDSRDHTEYDKVLRMLKESALQQQHVDVCNGHGPKVPPLKASLETLRECPAENRADGDYDEDDFSEVEIGTGSDDESYESEWSSNILEQSKVGSTPPRDQHLAIVVQSPRPVDNAIQKLGPPPLPPPEAPPTLSCVVEPPASGDRKLSGGSFVDARKPLLGSEPASDDRVVREPVADCEPLRPSACWLSCCGGPTGVEGVLAKVKTSGEAPHVQPRVEEHEQLIFPERSAFEEAQAKDKLPARTNGFRHLPEPPPAV